MHGVYITDYMQTDRTRRSTPAAFPPLLPVVGVATLLSPAQSHEARPIDAANGLTLGLHLTHHTR